MEQQNPESSLFQLNIDPNHSTMLKTAATWAKVMAILGFIFGALFIVLGIALQGAFNSPTAYDTYGSRTSSLIASSGLVIYLVFGILIVIGSVFAFNFANRISSSLKLNDPNLLHGGFAAIRNYFAYWSVLMIICLLLILISLSNGGLGRL